MTAMTKDEAIEVIEAAFKDVPRPTNGELLHPEVMDDFDVKDLFGIKHWTEMTQDEVIGGYAALSGASPKGFRHFIPAYMCHALRNSDSGDAYVSSTIWGLDPPMYAENLARFVASKYALFDDGQKAAVIAFLTAMTDSIYGDDALHALEYWS
jgi:hypothetical protein